jgi:hypothetical protein
MFGYLPPESSQELTTAKQILTDRLSQLESDIRRYVAKVTAD